MKKVISKIKESVLKIISERIGINIDTIRLSSPISFLDPESLNFTEAVMKIESELGASLNDEDILQAKTVNDFLLICEKSVIRQLQ